jgi:hypothetical protein
MSSTNERNTIGIGIVSRLNDFDQLIWDRERREREKRREEKKEMKKRGGNEREEGGGGGMRR